MKTPIVLGLVVLGLGSAAKTSHACSNIYFDKNGYSLLAHNMDWVSGEGMVVINKRHVQKRGFQVKNDPEFEWTSRYGSITLTFDGRESTGRGMNEAGLVILEAALAETQQSRSHTLPLLSAAQWTQYQLDTSATVEDVIASDKVVRIWPDDMQSHYIVRDGSGAIAVIEWLDGQMTVYQGDTLPVPATVNSTYESCIADGDDPTGRFKIIVDRLAAYDAAATSDGLAYAYSILQDVSNMLPPPVRTLWSVVFDVRAMRLYISTIQNTELRYVDLKDFDFSCQTDVEVLDINGAGSGNVRSSFVPYTTSFNREMVKRTYDIYASYGHPTPEDEIEQIVTFPDTTTCTDGDPGSQDGADGSVADAGNGQVPNDGGWAGDATASGVAGAGGSQPPAGDSGAGGATGTTSADAGSTLNGGGSSGCSCRIGRAGRGSTGLVVFLLCLGVAARHRRRPTKAAGGRALSATTPPGTPDAHP